MKLAGQLEAQPEPATRCSWCEREIPSQSRAFAISVSLRAEAFQEVVPGTEERLLLPKAEKQVRMIILPSESPAKRSGKDALFPLCSDRCAGALQSALREELGSAPNEPTQPTH